MLSQHLLYVNSGLYQFRPFSQIFQNILYHVSVLDTLKHSIHLNDATKTPQENVIKILDTASCSQCIKVRLWALRLRLHQPQWRFMSYKTRSALSERTSANEPRFNVEVAYPVSQFVCLCIWMCDDELHKVFNVLSGGNCGTETLDKLFCDRCLNVKFKSLFSRKQIGISQ